MPLRGIGSQFMLDTQYQNMDQSDQQKGLPQPPLELPHDLALPVIDLPDPTTLALPPVNLRAIIEERTTLRNHTPTPLSLLELSYLLWCTQGVKSVPSAQATRRTVPSAGSRHAFETILLINRVESLDPGLYRFLATEHKLLPLELGEPDDVTRRIVRASLNQEQVSLSAATFFWVAVPYRMTWRYGERGYRYLHLDAGHVCQNLYLAAMPIQCGVCAIAAFDDVELNTALHLDGDNEFVIYMATLGKRV